MWNLVKIVYIFSFVYNEAEPTTSCILFKPLITRLNLIALLKLYFYFPSFHDFFGTRLILDSKKLF
jgi:hypothetical protein